MSIGKTVKKIRELKGLKQEYVAEKLGITQQAYSKIEQSETLVESKIIKLAAILEVTAEDIKHFNESVLFNTVNHSRQLNHTPTGTLEKVIELYEDLLKQKDKIIALLSSKKKK